MDNIAKKFCIIRRRDGFTLVELIVVLVIIGILLALVTPNLTGYIDKAQATSCRKNRAELEKIYRYDTLLAKADGTATTISAVLKGENGKKLTCPSGGTYTYNETTEHLMCSVSKHNTGIISTNPIAAGVLGVIGELGITGNINSGATNDENTKKFIAALKEKGLDFDAMGIKSWAYKNSDGFYWTEVDISKLNVRDVVPVMKFNVKDGKFKELYSVWKGTVSLHKNPDYNYFADNISHNDSNEYSASKATELQKKKDYDTMNAIYQQALAEYYEKAAQE